MEAAFAGGSHNLHTEGNLASATVGNSLIKCRASHYTKVETFILSITQIPEVANGRIQFVSQIRQKSHQGVLQII